MQTPPITRTRWCSAPGREGSVGALVVEAELPPGCAVLCAGLETTAPVTSDAFEIALEDPVLARRITLRYGVVALAQPMG